MIRFFVVAALLALVAHSAAYAHETRTGWTYPYSCCGGSDCAELSQDHVRAVPKGYVVSIPPGAHPMWSSAQTHNFEAFISNADAKPSLDQSYHICLVPKVIEDHDNRTATGDPYRVACFWFGGGGF